MCGETLYQETKGRVLDRKDKTLWTRSESSGLLSRKFSPRKVS